MGDSTGWGMGIEVKAMYATGNKCRFHGQLKFFLGQHIMR